jgi:type I restriction enzyme S subunit
MQLAEIARWGRSFIDDTLSLKHPNFAKIPVRVPGCEEQQRIAAAFAPLGHELSLLHSKLTALRTQKRGLMQQLLTGKVRVPLPTPTAADEAA